MENLTTGSAVIIEICGYKFTEQEQETIRRVIKDYFGLKLGDKIIDLDINRNKSNKLGEKIKPNKTTNLIKLLEIFLQ